MNELGVLILDKGDWLLPENEFVYIGEGGGCHGQGDFNGISWGCGIGDGETGFHIAYPNGSGYCIGMGIFL